VLRGEDVVKYTRAQMIIWWGHLNRMGEKKNKNSEKNCGMESHREKI
jgi:hypothetical protein